MQSVTVPKWAEEGKMLADYIDQHFDSRKEFAKMMDVSDDKVSNWCRGLTRLKGVDRTKAAKILNISEALLRSKPAVQTVNEPRATYNIGREVRIARTGYRIVPIYAGVPAGNPSASYNDAVEILELPDWGNNFDRWGRIVEGDCMRDEFLDRDVVIFENRASMSGNAVHARKEGQDTFKIAIKGSDGTLTLEPLEPSFPVIDGKGWEILGVCIERRRDEAPGVTDIRVYRNGFIRRSNLP